MTERDALLAAIRTHPEEDTPRLVFADWLDENEPDSLRRLKKPRAAAPSAWAGLIRAECELARLADDGSASAAVFAFFADKDEQSLRGVRWERTDPGVARRVELRTLAERLRGPSGKARNVGRPKEAAAFSWTAATHRGFPHTLTAGDGVKLLAHLPALAARVPPVRVEFDPYPPFALEDAGELVAAGLPRWCRELRVSTDAGHADLVVAMSAHPDTANVRALHLGLSGDDPESERALGAVADSPHWSGLRELTLDGAGHIPPELSSRLFLAPHVNGLTRLTVRGTQEAANMVASVARVVGFPQLRSLALTNCDLTDDAVDRLAEATKLANLRSLDLQNNSIGGRGVSALLASPHLKNLAVLDLDHNPVRGLGRAALANAPAGGLRTVGFHGARLTASDIAALTSSPRLSELVYFDADDNGLAESAVARLVKGFGDRPPVILYLIGNGIGDAGVAALTNWPAAARIDMLHLSGNRLPTTAAKALAACPHLRGLTHLCAGTAHPAGRKALKARFGAARSCDAAPLLICGTGLQTGAAFARVIAPPVWRPVPRTGMPAPRRTFAWLLLSPLAESSKRFCSRVRSRRRTRRRRCTTRTRTSTSCTGPRSAVTATSHTTGSRPPATPRRCSHCSSRARIRFIRGCSSRRSSRC